MASGAPVRIGVLDDISGDDDGYERVFTASIAEARRLTGFEPYVELVYERPVGLPRGTAANVVLAFERVLESGVIAVLGPSITDNCLAVRDLADARQIPCLNWSGGSETRSGFMFQYQAGSLEEEPRVVAAHLSSRGLRRVALVHDIAATGRRAAVSFEEAAARHGLEITGRFEMAATADETGPELLDSVAAGRPDAVAHFGMFGIRPLSRTMRERGFELPVVSNIVASMAQNNPEWLPDLEGWCYIDMVSEGNRRLAELRPLMEEGWPRGPRLVTGLDLGQLLVHALVQAPSLDPHGVQEGLMRVKRLPAAAGRDGTFMGFGAFDRAALKGRYLVMRQYVDGRSVEWQDDSAPSTATAGT